MVSVNPNAAFKIERISFRVKLCGIDILTITDHLDRTGIRTNKMDATFRQGLNRFFVADKSLKRSGKPGGQRVIIRINSQCAIGWPNWFAKL